MLHSLKSVVVLFTSLLLCTNPVWAEKNKNTFQTPDFNFPQEVEKNARPVLEQALRTGDQNKAVRATLQISESRLVVSDHKLTEVMSFIDSVSQVGKFAPDYRALLYLYQSEVVDRISNYKEGGDDESDDISLWTRAKRDSLKNALLDQALDPLGNGDISVLRTPVTKYKDILYPGDKWGQRCMPYLYDLLMETVVKHMTRYRINRKEVKTAQEKWLSVHAQDKDLYPFLYINYKFLEQSYDSESARKAVLDKYKDREEIGLLYAFYQNWLERKDYYNVYKDYLKKFPHSPFVSYVRNTIAIWDVIDFNTNFPSLISSTQEVKIDIHNEHSNGSRYKVSLYRVPDNLKPTWKKICLRQFKLVDQKEVEVNKNGHNEVHFPPQPYGIYLVNTSVYSQGKWFSEDSISYDNIVPNMGITRQSFTVSDIRSFVIQKEDEIKIFAINAQDGKPLQGVSIWVQTKNHGDSLLCITDQSGSYTYKDKKSLQYGLTKGEDKYLTEKWGTKCSASRFRSYQKSHMAGRLFTDLAIYRPGETLQATGLVYQLTASKKELIHKRHYLLELLLLDTNDKLVERKEVTNDEWGQITASFQLPKDRLNGRFHLELKVVGNKEVLATQYFEVSEYKLPSFYIDLSQTEAKQSLDKPVVIRGKVLSFNGMPVAYQEVHCELNPRTFWASDTELDDQEFTVKTDQNGNFEYTCPAEWTKIELDEEDLEEDYICLAYRMKVKAECTDKAGETQTTDYTFQLGNSVRVVLTDDELLLPSDSSFRLPIKFESTDPSVKKVICNYALLDPLNDEKIFKKGTFSTDNPIVNWDEIPSGYYTLKVTVKDDKLAMGFEEDVTLFRMNDTVPPRNIDGLWVPDMRQSVTPDGKARILIGNNKPCHIYYIAKSRKEITHEGWLDYSTGLHWFELPMPEGKDEKLDVEFFSCIDGELESQNATLYSPVKDEIVLSAVTFRDKVTPGSKEHWTLKLTDANGQPVKGRMILDLYSMALEKLKSHARNWWFAPDYLYSALYSRGFTTESRNSFFFNYFKPAPTSHKYLSITEPFLRLYMLTYGEERLADVVVGMASTRNGFAGGALEGRIAGLAIENSADVLCEVAEVPIGKQSASKSTGMNPFGNVSVRTSKTHVALWRPTLTSDQEGNFQIEFDVPDDNTTWCMQALAFSRTMATCLMQKEILAQRTLMVQPSLPRFLRSGDKTKLMANVQNAADSAVKAVALVELFDPRTDKVLKSKKFNLRIAANGTEVVGIECEAPLDEPYIGFRVKVVDGQGNGDGEQQKLPVLPSTSMVTEGQPFFLTAGQGSVVLDVHRPSAGKSHSVLMACSNPTWYCISALPSIANTDLVTSTGLAHNLFALGMAASLVKNEPALDKVSRLRQDEDLKITTLQASPWTRAADQQEKRMQALSRLLNPEQNRADYNALMDKLLSLQKKDGGFGWFDNPRDTTASYWATSTVLQLMGRLRMLGCLPDEEKMSAVLNKALQYMDKEVMDNLKDDLLETGKVNVMYYADYAYICSLYDKDRPYKSAAIKLSTDLLRNKILSAMEKNWRKESLLNRAYCAVTLQRFGHEKEAQRIVESLKQLAINDKDKGMYWEKLPDGFWSHPVAHTATILEAMNEVAPNQYAVEIERVRQWLLLEKQTSDWGGSSLAADAVYALLRTGGDWLHAEMDTTPLLQIKIDGKPVDYEALNPLLGNMRMDLPADARRVEVVKSENHPAWGAVVHQYEAPMQEIKKQGVKELTLRKELWVQDDKGAWQRLSLEGKKGTQLRLGQKVQVRLIITCTKALEYLTLTDERPAS
ncbi:MAG: hypothetical protein IJS20_11010, partial [Bacteroidales bacterium]|nr:hypothetical protein [Bacteroidales bacterium]